MQRKTCSFPTKRGTPCQLRPKKGRALCHIHLGRLPPAQPPTADPPALPWNAARTVKNFLYFLHATTGVLPVEMQVAVWEFCGQNDCTCTHKCQACEFTKLCCICADKRPVAATYEQYRDGKRKTQVSRSAGYCGACKKACRART